MADKLKILGYNYTLKHIKNDDMRAFGRFNGETQEIIIADDIHKELQESSLIHEIVEALNFHMELNLAHNVITSLETGLYQVFRDNPRVLEFILS